MKNIKCNYIQHAQVFVICEFRRICKFMFKTKILLHYNNTLFGYNANMTSDANFLSTACGAY
jgi:hypothetical protein